MSAKTKSAKHIRDKWRSKVWYMVIAPSFFGNIELGSIPAQEEKMLIGRVVEATLFDITGDFSHHYLKMFFQIHAIEGKTAKTLFKGHEYSRDYLRSLVRRRTTKVDGLFNIVTKDGFKLRVSVSALTLSRIKTSQEKIIRDMMEKTIREKATALTMDQFVQEMVLGKIASDIYNQAKLVAPLRHVGIRKSKLIAPPAVLPKEGPVTTPMIQTEEEDEEYDEEEPEEVEEVTETDPSTEE